MPDEKVKKLVLASLFAALAAVMTTGLLTLGIMPAP